MRPSAAFGVYRGVTFTAYRKQAPGSRCVHSEEATMRSSGSGSSPSEDVSRITVSAAFLSTNWRISALLFPGSRGVPCVCLSRVGD